LRGALSERARASSSRLTLNYLGPASSLPVFGFFIWFCGIHGNNQIGSGLLVTVKHFNKHAIVLDFVFNFLADRQNSGMFRICGPDVILHVVGSQKVLLAKLFIGVDVRNSR